jgi:hypothetical protein
MANKPKSQQDRDRRAKVEAMRREQQSRERRKSLLFIVVAVVVGLGIVAAAAVPAYLKNRNDPANQALASFGVAASAADCSDPTDDPATGGADHKEEGTRITYDEVPPSSGPHWGQPAFPAREFYTARDRPAMEQLVHNLEHGYTILWYDGTVRGEQLQALKDIAKRARTEDGVGPRGKFIVSAWDDSYGKFPAGKHVALSHWGAKTGHRQLCGKVSGAVVASFIDRYPASDSPEPNAA